jgi:hypothetical protein
VESERSSRRPVGVAPESGGGRLIVICDDGSVWKWHHDGGRWEEMTPIPGTERAADHPARSPAGF